MRIKQQVFLNQEAKWYYVCTNDYIFEEHFELLMISFKLCAFTWNSTIEIIFSEIHKIYFEI